MDIVGFSIYALSPAEISSVNWTGVFATAEISPNNGREILPSGLTCTTLERSPFFHTVISKISSGPIIYSGVTVKRALSATALSAAPEVAFDETDRGLFVSTKSCAIAEADAVKTPNPTPRITAKGLM